MPKLKELSVDKLHLDLHNFRTVAQKTELQAVNSMISISPNKFWALLESLLDDGYIKTETIIVLEKSGKYTIKEGNRRVAAIKIILSKYKKIEIPDHLQTRIKELQKAWKKNNEVLPCTIYQESEIQQIEKLISLIHSKGEQAGRDQWTAVARARYARDVKKENELGLNLLESFLSNCKKLSPNQKESWSGDYHLTVLNDALRKLHTPMGYKSITELVKSYPKKNRSILEKILIDIGTQQLGFKQIRNEEDFFGIKYGIILPNISTTTTGQPTNPSTPIAIPAKPPTPEKPKPDTLSLTDPKNVTKILKSFHPKGKYREKVVTLLTELKNLNLEKHPHSFCFLLRSMFEISAKAYCIDHKAASGPAATKADGQDRNLVDILRDITNHLTNNKSDKAKTKELHGAMTELAKPDGILSVTSLNQLIHNPKFSITPSDISITFTNVFPLLEELNK
ncbi:hypothetical protein [Leptospira terpstrae]|uniref:Uncharacterized protein n=1 Tax=Leptospira terpstrae serovar Hualin str. LT 11-33 = ATCC 700639 TaxID=1257025 RepID=N1VZ38_9LEPT|nr:hypothetical protein [Leptospira terpstrae]EMY60686.1 hypothetical protein LEP1GSC203_0312 [Leptospira terpstrae serovar Hualin str. LT 11-33 = ATCC 700639]